MFNWNRGSKKKVKKLGTKLLSNEKGYPRLFREIPKLQQQPLENL